MLQLDIAQLVALVTFTTVLYDCFVCDRQVQQRVGYCPQFDALINKLTVRETLTMYARIRGIPEGEIKSTVNSLISRMLLEDYTNKLAGNLR